MLSFPFNCHCQVSVGAGRQEADADGHGEVGDCGAVDGGEEFDDAASPPPQAAMTKGRIPVSRIFFAVAFIEFSVTRNQT